MTNGAIMHARVAFAIVLALSAPAAADEPAPPAPTPPDAAPALPDAPPPAPTLSDAQPPAPSAPPAASPPPAATVAPLASPDVRLTAPLAPPPTHHERVLVAGKLGGIVPFDGLSPFVSIGLEAGYVLPVANHQLAIVLDVDYTQPTTTGREPDPRVIGGSYSWKLTEQELGIMPALIYRLTAISPVVPYGGIGPRILLARSIVRDNGSPAIMETHEQSTKIGIGVPLGGPGFVIGDLRVVYSKLDNLLTGASNAGNVVIAAGYRLVF